MGDYGHDPLIEDTLAFSFPSTSATPWPRLNAAVHGDGADGSRHGLESGRALGVSPGSSIDDLLAAARSTYLRVDAASAYAEQQQGAAYLVDTRPGWQRLDEGTIPGAILIERNHLEWRLDPRCPARIAEATSHEVRWIVICAEGYSSSLAAAVLRVMGLSRATDVIGGFEAWVKARLPVGPRFAGPPSYSMRPAQWQHAV